jgi:Flp pilus assembly protein CpaB
MNGETTMQRRSTTIVLAGLLALMLGAATTVSALRGHGAAAAAAPDGSSAAGAPAGTADKIPDGKRALAVSLDPVAGTAGVAHAGSKVDVFAAVAGKEGANEQAVRLVLQGVEVLRVDAASPGASTSNAKDVLEAARGTAVFVLAVTPAEAEKVVYHAAFSKLWFAVAEDGAPHVATPGVTASNQLQPEGV